MQTEIQNLAELTKVARAASLSLAGVNYLGCYFDPAPMPGRTSHFYDYQIGFKDRYVTLCQINQLNYARYEMLHKLNDFFKTADLPFIPSNCYNFKVGNQDWFFEEVAVNPINFILDEHLTIDDLKTIWKDAADINAAVEEILITVNSPDHNKLYLERETVLEFGNFKSLDRIKSNTPLLTLFDFEKIFDHCRIKRTLTGFTYTGLQAFLPVTSDVGVESALFFSTFNNTVDEIYSKINLLSTDQQQHLDKFLDTRIYCWETFPKYCLVDPNITITQAHRIKKILHEIYFT